MKDTPQSNSESIIPRIHSDTAEIAQQKLPPAPKLVVLDEEDPAHEKERQQAFDAEFSWRGRRLHGFTSSREALFSKQRLSSGAPSLQACLDDLDAFFGDAARILWLCSHTPDDWAILRSSPSELQKVIDQWTDENIPQREAIAAVRTAYQIYAASRANEHSTVPASNSHGDDLGN